MRFLISIFLGGFLFAGSARAVDFSSETPEDPIQIAVLDQNPRDFISDWPQGRFYVLPLFGYNHGVWKILDAPRPAHVRWTIAWNGRALGTLDAHLMSAQPLNDIHNFYQPDTTIRHPDKPKTRDGGPALFYRPLVLIRGGRVADPEEWKRRPLTPEAKAKWIAAFRKQYAQVNNCPSPNADPRPWAYSDSDLQALAVYGSKNGDFIVNTQLGHDHCNDVADDPFQTHQIAVPVQGPVVWMDEGLTLIDAGDYAGTGTSELLFSDQSGGGDDDNSDGYSLWSSDFKRLLQREWFYH